MTNAHGTQREKILALLLSGQWVPLPQITACAAQYNARIYELRRLGYAILNRTEEVNGEKHSWFRLEPAPLAKGAEKPRAEPEQQALFPARERCGEV